MLWKLYFVPAVAKERVKWRSLLLAVLNLGFCLKRLSFSFAENSTRKKKRSVPQEYVQPLLWWQSHHPTHRLQTVCSHLLTLVPRSRILSSILKMEEIRSSETSVCTISTRRHIPEDGILHSHCRENLKSYKLWLILLQPTGEVSADQVNAERLSYLEWLLSIISPESSKPQEPDEQPVDPSKCEPCSE
jgi:hypothetical protein